MVNGWLTRAPSRTVARRQRSEIRERPLSAAKLPGFAFRSTRLRLRSMPSQLLRLAGQQPNEAHADQVGPLEAVFGAHDLRQSLVLIIGAERQHHAAAHRELIDQRLRHRLGRRGYDDAVE